MKTVLSMVALIFIISLGLNPSARAHTDVNVEDAKSMIESNPQLIVVDVRAESTEYCGPLGHIPGSLNYPWPSVLRDQDGYQDLLPEESEILVVCLSGGRSNSAATFLDGQGFTNVYDMVGGMTAWTNAGYGTVDCCYADEDCSDGLYCTGGETCLDLNCQPGPGTPCVSPEWCDEDQDSCIVCLEDYDCDGILDDDDTCPEYHDPLGEDTLPPVVGNGCGDACDCEGNFNADVDDDVDGSDAAVFKADFGRGGYNNPCSNSEPCNGDFDCDTDIDGSDAAIFKADFGRGGYNNPCPACTAVDPWCGY